MLTLTTPPTSPLGLAVKALREGVATEQQWQCAAIHVAVASRRQGPVRGLQGHIQAADQALQGIHASALHAGRGRWAAIVPQFQELDALQTFMDLHELQTTQPHPARTCRARHFERQTA